MLRTFAPLVLPNDVLSLEGERFLDLVNKTCGNIFKELMEVLSINTVYKLLLVENDILSVFQKKYRELEKITERACLHLDDGSIFLKPGLRLDFDRFIAALHVANDKNQYQDQILNSNNDFLSLFKAFIKSFQINEDNDSRNNFSFLFVFIENVLSNLLKNKNNYRYDEAVMQFAQSLYILGGRNAYEFIRMNLPAALPSLSTLNDSLKKAGGCIEEAEFRFNALHEHQKSLDYQVAVCSEDCTGVIKKIKYNASTNIFSGFSVPLKNGLPVARQETGLRRKINHLTLIYIWYNLCLHLIHIHHHFCWPPMGSAISFKLLMYSIGGCGYLKNLENRMFVSLHIPPIVMLDTFFV
jgi:hypothetical protein